MTSTLTAVAATKLRLDQYWKKRKISTPSSLGSSPTVKLKSLNGLNGTEPIAEDTSTLRQKTATLKRRDTFNGKIPVVPHPTKWRRPRRSVSDESSGASSASVFRCHDDDEDGSSTSAFETAQKKLSTDERWSKEIALGTRIGLYRLYRDLGKGNFSKVKVAVHWMTKEKVAVKIIDKTKLQPKSKLMLSKEVSIMETIRHPNIIRLFEVLESPTKVYLAMEFAEGGELFDKITTSGKFSEPEAKIIFSQVTSAVMHMHKHNIVHRDIKAENIFITTTHHVKVGDFGFSTRIRSPGEPLLTKCGSPPYLSPEMLRDEDYMGPSVDLWSLGVLLYFMVTATLPFRGDTLSVVKKKILAGNITLPKFLSQECVDLVRGLLQSNPGKRLTAVQVKTSSWMKGVPFQFPAEQSQQNEKEAKALMLKMGITDAMLKSHKNKGARSSVNGTHRIILHKIEERTAVDGKQQTKKFLKWPNFQSKTCVIM